MHILAEILKNHGAHSQLRVVKQCGTKLIDRLCEALRARHYIRRTQQTYYHHWVKRYISFHHVRHPAEIGESESKAFLNPLSVNESVSTMTQKQALCAPLLLLYPNALDKPIGYLGEVIRTRRLHTLKKII